jgi:gamma-glutamyltranspeptidase/glutathione hydrolase
VVAEPRHTTHFSVVDRRGDAVAVTTTLNSWFGSAVTVEGAGFLLNNEMDDFASKPGRANQFGLVQGERNAIAPGKRMLSAMSPTIVLDRACRPTLVTGAAGGPYIITTVFQLISNRLDYGLDVGASMSAPRIHHQHLPDVLCLETGGFGEEQILALRRLGHRVETFESCKGGSGAASIERRDGRWWGASDPRGTGLAEGH